MALRLCGVEVTLWGQPYLEKGIKDILTMLFLHDSITYLSR